MVVFGANSDTVTSNYILSEEGELEEDLSKDWMIPRGVGFTGCYTIQQDKIKALDHRMVSGEWRVSIEHFNGKKWMAFES